jgi:hypothetical protein
VAQRSSRPACLRCELGARTFPSVRVFLSLLRPLRFQFLSGLDDSCGWIFGLVSCRIKARVFLVLHCVFVVVSLSRPQDVRLNACETVSLNGLILVVIVSLMTIACT